MSQNEELLALATALKEAESRLQNLLREKSPHLEAYAFTLATLMTNVASRLEAMAGTQ